MVIDGDGFRLRPLTLADADAWLAGEDDEMRRGFEFPRASTRDDVVRAIEGWMQSWRTGAPLRKWAITDAATGAIIGGLELRPLDSNVIVDGVERSPSTASSICPTRYSRSGAVMGSRGAPRGWRSTTPPPR